MNEEIKIEESSGNVFLDIGFSREEAERELLSGAILQLSNLSTS